jgi:hypothetical protein
VLPTGVELPALITPPPILAGGPLRLLYAAWLDERAKRVMDLAPLADGLTARGVDFVLTIAGRGPAAARLASALASHVAAGRVRMLGAMSLEEMARLHREHDVLLLVSGMEGAPQVVMEAMGHGRMAAVTRGCGGALEAVRDGESGIVVDVGDMTAMATRLAALASMPRRIAAMGERARRAAEAHFDLSRLAGRYDALVEEAVAAAPGPHASRPDEIAWMWERILAALEFIGPCTSAELASLAAEWLSDLGVRGVALDPGTADDAAIVDAITRFGSGVVDCVVGQRSASWMGWHVQRAQALPPGMLILSAAPEQRSRWPGVWVMPLRLPGLPTLAARRLTAAVGGLRSRGVARIALYGAGKHTRKLARCIGSLPEIIGIVDDRAGDEGGPGTRLWGLPIAKPGEFESLAAEAVIVSSDEHERAMLPRAREWAGKREVVALYEELEQQLAHGLPMG